MRGNSHIFSFSARLCDYVCDVCVCVSFHRVTSVVRELPGILFTSFVQFWSAHQRHEPTNKPELIHSLQLNALLLLVSFRSYSRVPLTILRLMHKRHRNFSLFAVTVQVCVPTRHRENERESWLFTSFCLYGCQIVVLWEIHSINYKKLYFPSIVRAAWYVKHNLSKKLFKVHSSVMDFDIALHSTRKINVQNAHQCELFKYVAQRLRCDWSAISGIAAETEAFSVDPPFPLLRRTQFLRQKIDRNKKEIIINYPIQSNLTFGVVLRCDSLIARCQATREFSRSLAFVRLSVSVNHSSSRNTHTHACAFTIGVNAYTHTRNEQRAHSSKNG